MSDQSTPAPPPAELTADRSQHASPLSGQSLPTRLKLSRTSTPKVRTGCITCKKRHVKCDEAKPQCGNCIKTRGYCEGYEATKKKKKPVAGMPEQICWDSNTALTRTSPNGSSVGSSPQTTRGISPSSIPFQITLDSLEFGDAAGKRYFDEFVRLVRGPWIVATSNSDLWGNTLPQVARNSTTLRHAAMGIGALIMWHRQSKHKSLRSAERLEMPTATDGEDSHAYRAVAHYGKSLKMLSKNFGLQDAIFMSMLLLCFESLRGNRTAAIDHVNHGLALLLYLVMDGNVCGQDLETMAPDPKPLIAAIGDIFTHLGNQARCIFPSQVGGPLSLPNFSKGLRDKAQTMESFAVLISQLPRDVTATIDRMPAVFTTLDEFEKFWTLVRREQTAVGPLVLQLIHDSGVLHSADGQAIHSFVQGLISHPAILEHCANARRLVKALDAAFTPLFQKMLVNHDPDTPAYLRTIYLRLQYLAIAVFDDFPQYYDIDSLTANNPGFRDYLSMAEIAVRAARRQIKTTAHQLSLHADISLRLLHVALMCRDPILREEAVFLLRDYPGQDGLFNTRGMYAVARRNRVVEAGNTVEGTPQQQWERLWRREFAFENGGDRVLFRYLVKDEAEAKWVLVEEWCDTRGKSDNVVWHRQMVHGEVRLLSSSLFS
ncbi:uncharacterized protein E0L32_003160 [Thyridium curvatum]|uniref:Zn(2)-C6 fungal-type domain-containing protein n=1 Tax=Thyridium curvatum TaxID=1093900 RepID=A0A507BC86_9PEZI|nr:uncharacterized protein E0L32_003160 [Thyridium curvatum]TPX17517.1 hypothetical protein E0L32_003160 [Thyridium curvatum]